MTPETNIPVAAPAAASTIPAPVTATPAPTAPATATTPTTNVPVAKVRKPFGGKKAKQVPSATPKL